MGLYHETLAPHSRGALTSSNCNSRRDTLEDLRLMEKPPNEIGGLKCALCLREIAFVVQLLALRSMLRPASQARAGDCPEECGFCPSPNAAWPPRFCSSAYAG